MKNRKKKQIDIKMVLSDLFHYMYIWEENLKCVFLFIFRLRNTENMHIQPTNHYL